MRGGWLPECASSWQKKIDKALPHYCDQCATALGRDSNRGPGPDRRGERKSYDSGRSSKLGYAPTTGAERREIGLQARGGGFDNFRAVVESPAIGPILSLEPGKRVAAIANLFDVTTNLVPPSERPDMGGDGTESQQRAWANILRTLKLRASGSVCRYQFLCCPLRFR